MKFSQSFFFLICIKHIKHRKGNTIASSSAYFLSNLSALVKLADQVAFNKILNERKNKS